MFVMLKTRKKKNVVGCSSTSEKEKRKTQDGGGHLKEEIERMELGGMGLNKWRLHDRLIAEQCWIVDRQQCEQ